MVVGGFRPFHVVVTTFFFKKNTRHSQQDFLLAFIETPKQISVFWQKCHFERCFAFLAWSDFHAHLPVSPVLQSMKKNTVRLPGEKVYLFFLLQKPVSILLILRQLISQCLISLLAQILPEERAFCRRLDP